jgi:GrpB-like predicted nucleotidyltransferase (UPF0157 family)
VRLGLSYRIVELVEHSLEWQAAFADERARLAPVLPADCILEHIGSTAVPGLVAKPILDIAIATTADPDAIKAVLAQVEYIYRGDAGAEGGHVFVRESAPRVRTHHVHLVRPDDPQLEGHRLFRDFLRATPAARDRYAAEKLTLASTFAVDRKAYTAAKQRIVERLLAEARATSR